MIQSSRTMVGHTNPAQAPAGTVRGDFSVHVSRYLLVKLGIFAQSATLTQISHDLMKNKRLMLLRLLTRARSPDSASKMDAICL